IWTVEDSAQAEPVNVAADEACPTVVAAPAAEEARDGVTPSPAVVNPLPQPREMRGVCECGHTRDQHDRGQDAECKVVMRAGNCYCPSWRPQVQPWHDSAACPECKAPCASPGPAREA